MCDVHQFLHKRFSNPLISYLSFIKIGSEVLSTVNDRKIKEVFERWDTDLDGYLVLEDFISFYHNAAQQRPKHVWHNLSSYHYRNDLRKEYEVEQGEVNVKILPRYLISKNAEYYHVLFKLIEEKGKIADDVWRLLNRLPTSPEILKKVMSLEGVKTGTEGTPDWKALLDIQNNYLLLYCLNVFEYLMEDESAKEYQLESDQFRTDFIFYGGFEHLFNVFKAYNEKDRKSLSFLDKNILNFILKIIKNYVIAALCNKIPRLNRMIYLIRVGYINLNNLVELLNCESLSSKEFVDDKKMEGVRKKMEETTENKELSEKLKGELGDKVLETIDLVSFKDGLLQLGLDILMKDVSEIEIEERGIIELILVLLLGIYLYSETSLLSLIKPGLHEAFYLNGLFCFKSQIIRKYFHHAFFILIRERKEVLGGYYIKMLLENLPDGFIMERKECIQFYEVLCKLLEECYSTFEFDYSSLALQMIEKLKLHQSQETRSQPYPDNILLGYMNLLGKVFEVNPSLRKQHAKFAFYLFEECLFDINPKPSIYKEEFMIEVANNSSKDKELLFNNYVKCKSNQTRRSTYKVVAGYVKNHGELFEEILDKCIIPLIKRAPRTDRTWNFSPMFNGRSSQAGFAGIRNLGCICYMTAMIQQFFMNEPFRYALLRANDKQEINEASHNGVLVDDNVLHQMQKLFVFLELTDRQDFNPFEFCFSFKDYSGMPVNVLVQADAQEFINMIFEKLENSLKATPFCQVLENVYGGKVCNQMICSNCKNVNSKYETFYNLSVVVKNAKNIYESLNKYIAGETISDYKCENCLKKVDINKRCVLSSLPNVLIIHLQRLVFNLDTLMNEKINSRLEFPQELNMQAFTKQEIERREKEKEAAAAAANNNANANPAEENPDLPKSLIRKSSSYSEESSENFHEKNYYEYQLKGVVNHMGSAEAGHYYSYIKLYEGKWLEMNDSVVKDFDYRLLEQECFGGSSGVAGAECVDDYWSWEGKENAKSAYILVYERKLKEPFTLKIANPEDLTCVADLKRSNVEDSPSSVTVEYYDMKRYIPENYYECVWNDNHEFMLEKHIYNEDFFKFILEFFRNTPSFPFNQKDAVLPIYYNDHGKIDVKLKQMIKKSVEIILKYISEILFRANDKNTLADTSKLLRGLLLLIPEEMSQIADAFIFQKPKEIYELLLACPELGVRTTVQQILLSIITVLIEHNGLFDKIDEKNAALHEKVMGFLNSLLNLMPSEVAKNWTKFQNYFEVINKFLVNG